MDNYTKKNKGISELIKDAMSGMHSAKYGPERMSPVSEAGIDSIRYEMREGIPVSDKEKMPEFTPDWEPVSPEEKKEAEKLSMLLGHIQDELPFIDTYGPEHVRSLMKAYGLNEKYRPQVSKALIDRMYKSK